MDDHRAAVGHPTKSLMAVVTCQGHKGFQSWKGLRSSGAASLAPSAGGEPGRLLECTAERGLGVIPDLRADRRRPIMEQPQHPADHIIAEARERLW
jgi:hypothetical protein